jgi:Hint domain
MSTYTGGFYETVTITSANNPLVIEGVVRPGGDSAANGVQSSLTGASVTLAGSYSRIDGGQSDNPALAGGAGIDLTGASTVDIQTNTNVVGGNGTLDLAGTAGAVGGVGVFMSGGGSLTTGTFGIITGGAGVAGGGAGAQITGSAITTVTNSGIIFGGAGEEGQAGGVGVQINGNAHLHNYDGTVYGGAGLEGGAGLTLLNGGSATNDFDNFSLSKIQGGAGMAGGKGGTGVSIGASGTLTNAGYIKGGYGTVSIASGGAGSYVGGYGAEVDTGGTLTNTGHIYGGKARIGEYSGGVLTPGTGVYLDGGTLANSGIISGGLDNTGSYGVYAPPGDAVKFGTATGSTLSLEAVTNKDGVTLGGVLQGDITGFEVGDKINIYGQSSNAIIKTGSTTAGDYTLTTTADGSLDFTGNYNGEHFVISAYTFSGGVGTQITLAACYRRGTRIQTATGEAPIETLRIGDHLMTLCGVTRPIRWIGRRHYSGMATQNNREVLPIRICAGAMGAGLPRRDLWVSPEHSMWIEGLLVPANALVNGVSVIQEEEVDDVAYFHIEFDSHDVIFAEGTPSESFVDDDSRENFDNAEEYRKLYPDAVAEPALFCAPRVEEGVSLEAIRQQIREYVGELAAGADWLRQQSARPQLRDWGYR